MPTVKHLLNAAPTNWVAVWIVVLVGCLLYRLSRLVYNIYFHPLARFPGPLLYRASRLPYVYHMARGDLTFLLLPMHEKYGPIVRIAPDELAFVHPDAFNDIYGHRVGNNHASYELTKSARFYGAATSDHLFTGVPNIITEEDRHHHGVLRRLFSHGLSDQGLRNREYVITGNADKLVRMLRQRCISAENEGERVPLNMTSWYNFVSVDVISQLLFGESSMCLDRGDDEFNPWVQNMNHTTREFIPLQLVRYLGMPEVLNKMLRRFAPSRKQHMAAVVEKITRRLGIQMNLSVPDLVHGVLQRKDAWGIRDDEILGNVAALLIAGSESTATLMTGMTYILCKHPTALAKLQDEIRSKFESDQQINLTAVLELPYLLACLDEALRCYPPLPIGLPRTVPKGSGGVTIAGELIPEDTDVAVWHWPMYHYSKHWDQPLEYRPERHLRENTPRFAGDNPEKYMKSGGQSFGDRLDLLQPFLVGPRNCLGRNLAYFEMRVILAKMIFNFDFELVNPDQDWIGSQRADFFWLKGPLCVYLKARS